MKKLLLAGLFTFSLVGCATTPDQPQDTMQETIRYSSSPCFGTCPIYSVEVSPSGAVHFDGKQYTKVIGTQELTVDPSVYKKLQQELKTYRPETGANVKTTGCVQTATDQPSAYFWWKRPDGSVTRLSHYQGCISPANAELNKLIEKLPTLIGIEDLVR
ncbi:hypothetical protein HWI77_08465 [Acinetobacter venetianus]|jgi:hypothetical protein|uniref:DUF6438 domain-containing protein n=1 Tax=Acinetobacter venetianus TaxID=52133 RepID=UPI0007786212|nr:DUF6438 domain-containing protein [Acinetobacter venetianus]KXZ64026.1 hypothetical protein AVENLUH7437_02325 [Acinetobacter venetianus]QNH52722.1 hypothetical protein HWI77_08465 [Acinetobacter venetianus]